MSNKYRYELDAAGREAAKAVVAEWCGYAFRTGAMSADDREAVAS